MGRSSARTDRILTMDQVRLIVALHDADLCISGAAKALGIKDGTARARINSIELHTGIDVLTIHGMSQLYDGARALVEMEAQNGQAD